MRKRRPTPRFDPSRCLELASISCRNGWATGSSWPRPSKDALADLVVGKRPFPNSAACWTVAGLLAAAAVSVSAQAGIPRPNRARRIARLGASTTAGALLVRGFGGLVASGCRLGRTTDEFRRHDLRIYSPLCLALGAGAMHSVLGR